MPPPKKVQAKQPSNNLCCFCNSDEDNELLFGKIHRMDDIVTHYYCLLLSSNMEQNGADDQGILGFMREDILKEMRRGKRLICSYCRTNGATLGCCNSKCKKVFHLPCGQKAGSLHQFFGQFKSYCSSHRPMQRVDQSLQKGRQTCAICYEDVVPRPTYSTLWASCCRKNAWFHRNCVQQLAMSAGYFFKCPLCNNKSAFQTTMLNYGIYIPERDASWELVPNAFQELLHRHDHCDAPTRCLCPKGRNYDMQGTRWGLVLCHLCGSQGIHLGCGNLKWTDPKWECNECKEMLENAQDKDDEPGAETNGNEGSTPNIADQSRSRGRRSNARSQHRLARGNRTSHQSLARGRYAAIPHLRAHDPNTNDARQPLVTHSRNISEGSDMFSGLCSSRSCFCGETSTSQQESRTRCSCHRLKENTFKPEYFKFKVGPNDVKMSYRKFFLCNLKVAVIKNKTSCKQHVTSTDKMVYPEPSLPHTESSNQQLAAYTTSESPLNHKNLLMTDKTGLCSESIPLTSSSDDVESSNQVGRMHSTPPFLLSPSLQKSSFVSESMYNSANSNQAQRSECIQRDVLIPSHETSSSVHNPLNNLPPNSWFSKINVIEKPKSVTFSSGLVQGENHAPQPFLSIKQFISSFVHNKQSWLPHSLHAESQLPDAKNQGLISSSKQNFTITSASVSEQGDENQNHNITGETFRGNDSFSQFSGSPDHSYIDDLFSSDGNTPDIAVQKHCKIEEISNSTNVPIESPPIAITPNNQRRSRNRVVHGKSTESRCSTSSSGGISSEPRISGVKTRSKSFEELRKLRRINGRARVWNTTPDDSGDNKFSGKRNDTQSSSESSSGNTLLINQRPASSKKICRELYNEETMADKKLVSGNTVEKEENLVNGIKDSYSSNIYEKKASTIKPKSSKQRDCDTNKLQCKRKRSSSSEGQRIKRCVSPMLTRSSSRHTSRRLRCRKAPRRSVFLKEYDVPMHKPKLHGPLLLNLQIDSGRRRVQHAITVTAELTSSAGDLEDKSELSNKVEVSHSLVTAHVTEMQNDMHSTENSEAGFAEDINDGMKPILPVDDGCSTQNMLHDFNLKRNDPYVKDTAEENLVEVNFSACASTSNLNSVEHPLSTELNEENQNCNKIIQDGREVLLPKESNTNGGCDKSKIPSTNCHSAEASVSHSATTNLSRKRRWQSCNIFSEDSSSLSSSNDFYIPNKLMRCHSNDYLENTSSAFSEYEQNIKYSSGDLKVLNNNMLQSDPITAEAHPPDSNSGESTSQRAVQIFDDVLKIKAKALTARKFRPPSQSELLQREMLRQIQHHKF